MNPHLWIGLVGFVLFKDTWFQYGHSVSCMTIFFFINLQISRSDIRPHIKWAARLVILHMVTSVFLKGLLCVGVYGLPYSFLCLQNYRIRHQPMHNIGCQPSDCRWQIVICRVCLGMYGLTYSLYYPEGGCPLNELFI